ncbi:MAG: hypothetical protein SWZ49_10995 [Cyanobacteriota bacterium]|nr:hypothetical protein [Cyanobacteriota bacterium]
MLRERLTVIPEENANILTDEESLTREIDLDNTNEVMTELMRVLAFHDFKTMDADPTRWSMQGNLIKSGQRNSHKIQAFVNISESDNAFVQFEIVSIPEKPQILVQGNFKTTEVLEMIRNLPYFPRD